DPGILRSLEGLGHRLRTGVPWRRPGGARRFRSAKSARDRRGREGGAEDRHRQQPGGLPLGRPLLSVRRKGTLPKALRPDGAGRHSVPSVAYAEDDHRRLLSQVFIRELRGEVPQPSVRSRVLLLPRPNVGRRLSGGRSRHPARRQQTVERPVPRARVRRGVRYARAFADTVRYPRPSPQALRWTYDCRRAAPSDELSDRATSKEESSVPTGDTGEEVMKPRNAASEGQVEFDKPPEYDLERLKWLDPCSDARFLRKEPERRPGAPSEAVLENIL